MRQLVGNINYTCLYVTHIHFHKYSSYMKILRRFRRNFREQNSVTVLRRQIYLVILHPMKLENVLIPMNENTKQVISEELFYFLNGKKLFRKSFIKHFCLSCSLCLVHPIIFNTSKRAHCSWLKQPYSFPGIRFDWWLF